MATKTITTNYNSYDGTNKEALRLTVTLSNGTLNWSAQATPYTSGETIKWDLYNIAVSIGGVSVFSGTLGWDSYSYNTNFASGSIALANVTISSGQVSLSISCGVGATWQGLVSASDNIAVASPTATLTITEGGAYSSKLIGGRSTLTFTMSGSSNSGGSVTSMVLKQGSTTIKSVSSGSGSYQMTCPNITSNSQSYSYTLTVTDSNGTTTTTSAQTKTVYKYVKPQFSSVLSTRWSSGSSSGSASDTGTYMRAKATYSSATIGGSASGITTSCTVEITSVVSATSIPSSNTYVYVGGSLDKDTAYRVTYKLWDSILGSSNALIMYDTLSVGGRCIDMTYNTSSKKYGVAIGTKAIAGRFDVNMPLHGTQMMDSAGKGATLTSAQRQAICSTLGIATTSDLNTILTTIIGRL